MDRVFTKITFTMTTIAFGFVAILTAVGGTAKLIEGDLSGAIVALTAAGISSSIVLANTMVSARLALLRLGSSAVGRVVVFLACILGFLTVLVVASIFATEIPFFPAPAVAFFVLAYAPLLFVTYILPGWAFENVPPAPERPTIHPLEPDTSKSVSAVPVRDEDLYHRFKR